MVRRGGREEWRGAERSGKEFRREEEVGLRRAEKQKRRVEK